MAKIGNYKSEEERAGKAGELAEGEGVLVQSVLKNTKNIKYLKHKYCQIKTIIYTNNIAI